ncbi:MAG: alpha/beta hydrolase-fold protein [Pyrinomonadaceae bacterium]|nr:alpha/beta hydrolase-fold protein [Pyrinomonadaceae bacterium]
MNLIHTAYQPSGEGPFPTILTLHGRGANAMDLLGLAPLLCGGKFLMICPQGPLETPIGPGMTGYAWYPMSMGGPPDVDAILSSRRELEAFIDRCLASYPIDRKKFALLGFSQGGVMSYSLALTHPGRFAALAVLSSWLPKELEARLNVSDAVQALPTLIQHGTQDPMIEFDRARDSVKRLRQLKLPLTFREYDMAHEITPGSLRDLSAWLDEKVLKT